MKRIIAVSFALLWIFSFVSCSDDDGGATLFTVEQIEENLMVGDDGGYTVVNKISEENVLEGARKMLNTNISELCVMLVNDYDTLLKNVGEEKIELVRELNGTLISENMLGIYVYEYSEKEKDDYKYVEIYELSSEADAKTVDTLMKIDGAHSYLSGRLVICASDESVKNEAINGIK
ncbi:MAG: hypothetical protein IJZ93_03720 [Clostridia bacterium]|nr:hypothetical protein [Clostridia bacterium]